MRGGRTTAPTRTRTTGMAPTSTSTVARKNWLSRHRPRTMLLLVRLHALAARVQALQSLCCNPGCVAPFRSLEFRTSGEDAPGTCAFPRGSVAASSSGARLLPECGDEFSGAKTNSWMFFSRCGDEFSLGAETNSRCAALHAATRPPGSGAGRVHCPLASCGRACWREVKLWPRTSSVSGLVFT